MSDLKFGVVFDVNNGRFKSEVKENTQLIQKLGGANQVAAGKSRQFGAELDTTEKKLFSTNKVAQAVTLSIASMATGFSAGLLLTQLSDTTQKFQVLRATLETATGGVDEAGLAFDRLQVFASKTPFSVEESIQAFIKLKNLGLDPTESALNSYGNTASAMGKSLDQFIEAVADASVSEFERLKEFGIKAKNQGDTIAFTFRKMKTEVANNAEAIEQYLQNLGENEFAGAMERQAATYDGALSNMEDSWDQLLLKISDDGAGDALENVIRGITSNLDLLGNNTQAVADVFAIGLVVATGHVVNALSNKTAAVVRDTVATRAANQAALTLTKTELSQAQSANLRAIQEQAAAQRMLKNAQNADIRSRAITNLARANGQLAASEKLVAIATNNVTIATNKANIAMKLGGGAMALLGGPTGVAILGAYALYELAGAMDETKSGADQLSESLGKTTKSITEMTRAEHLSTQASYRKLITEKKAAIDELEALAKKQKENSNASGSLYDGGEIASIVSSGQADEARAELEALKNALSDVEGALFDAGMEKIKWNDVVVNGVDVSSPKKPPEQDKKSADKLANDLAQVEKDLQTKEEAINASYLRRQAIVDTALLGKKGQEEKYNKLSLALEQQKDEALNGLALDKQAAEQKLRDDKIQAELNTRELLDQQRRDSWETEIAELQGYHSRLEAEEAAHNERVMEVKTRKTGELQGTLMQFANWQTKTETEKTSAVISLGEKGFAAMASQSKKAFAAYKAFSIAQALIKTYEGATSAYSALAPIPIVGPALGVAAAGAAVAMGLAQVNAIKSQKPQGFATGGRIGQGQNVIEFGESNQPEVLEFGGQNYLLGGNGGSVFNRSQLQPVGSSGGRTGSSPTIVYLTNHIKIEGNSNPADVENAIALSTEKMRADLSEDFATGGELTQQLKAAM